MRNGAFATVTTNGTPQKSNNPKLLNTAKPEESTPQLASQVLFLIQLSLKIIQGIS